MSFFHKAMDVLKRLEYNKPSNVLHHLAGEKGYTFMGIYESANPNWTCWKDIYKTVIFFDGDIKKSSIALSKSEALEKEVDIYYKREYWDKMKLDFVQSQKIAEELFVFGVNVHPLVAIKKAQKLIGVNVDGWVGVKTLKALNDYDPKLFDIEFDKVEIVYYQYLAFSSKRRKHFKQFYNGWVNRAKAV